MYGYGHPDFVAQRKKWQNPDVVLADVGLKAGSTFVDVGCGTGFFAVPAARLVGSEGKVYGVDSSREAIANLHTRISDERLTNLRVKVARAEDTVFCSQCADIVFFGIVLHDFEEPRTVLLNARKMLKTTGKLVNLDWKKEPMPFGPPPEIKLGEDEAVSLIESSGFVVENIKQYEPYSYLIIARPKSS